MRLASRGPRPHKKWLLGFGIFLSTTSYLYTQCLSSLLHLLSSSYPPYSHFSSILCNNSSLYLILDSILQFLEQATLNPTNNWRIQQRNTAYPQRQSLSLFKNRRLFASTPVLCNFTGSSRFKTGSSFFV